MKKDSEQNLDKLHKKILEIFSVYSKICTENNLKYYAIGGTCIGAVRHKGFIPWDDDLDVAMPIDDYLKFIDICKNRKEDNYRLLNYKNDDGSLKRKYVKLHDINTAYVEKELLNDYSKYTGIFVDIMPIIGCPKNKLKKKIFTEKLEFYYILDNIRNCSIDSKITFLSRMKWRILHPILSIFKKDLFAKCYDKLLLKYEISSKNDLLFAWRIPLIGGYSNVFPFEWFKEGKKMKFENTFINCPIDSKSYLTKDFDDYMKLPPEENRYSFHNVAIVDYEKSYKNYINK